MNPFDTPPGPAQVGPSVESAENPEAPQEHIPFSRRNSRRAVYVQVDDGEGNWLVSYADLMTLLFGFFVMLSAFSTPSGEKLEKLKRAAAESLGGRYTRPYQDLSQNISAVLTDYKLEKDTKVRETEEGLRVTIRGTVFFDSGSADLRPQARALLGKLADVLKERAPDYRIVVEGHTDDSPISSPLYPSNWELSSARAGVVVRLLESRGFDGKLLRPLGMSDKEPLAPNRGANGEALPANQAENRRIVIRIQKNLIPRVSTE